ncbi:MAG: DUF1552 domain-containing protein [Myxococcota bacterium]|nr:DUF1552 domain-containing protein [Myxococcota bacterium]
MASPTSIGRRNFLKGLSGAFLGLPALTRSGFAQTQPVAKRLVIFFSPNGTSHQYWRPTGTETNFQFGAGSILEPLSSHKSDLLVLDGIDFHNATNHEGGMAAMLTGGGGTSTMTGGASVDQYVAAAVGQQSRFSSLEFGVHTSAWGGSTQTRMSYSTSGQMVPPDDNPDSCFRRLFGNVSQTDSERTRIMMRKQSIIDLVRGEVEDLKSRLGQIETNKLNLHLEAIRDMELNLNTSNETPTTGCSVPMINSTAHTANDSFPDVGRAQMDMLVAALACDMTKVASIQWSHTVSPTVFSWLGISEGHHALSHIRDSNVAGIQDFVATERWFAQQFAYLIDRLKTLPEPGGTGTMLENSVVIWTKEMGDPRMHDCLSVPFVIAGQGNGYFSTGRYLQYDHAPHQKLLVSLCQSMGLNNPTFGEPSFGTGVLENLRG